MVYREDGDVLEPSIPPHPARKRNADAQHLESTGAKKTGRHSTEYCLCNGPETIYMIQCNGCDDWFHYPCVALQPADPPKIEQYFCPVCYRAGVGQSKWYGGAVFTKHQNKRVHEELLRRNVLQQATGISLQSRVGTLDAASRLLRYEQKRELYVKKSANGELSTTEGIPIVVNPPYNAPLPTPKRAVQETPSLSRRPLQPFLRDQHHFSIKNRFDGGGMGLSPSTDRPSTSQLLGSPPRPTIPAQGMSQSLSAKGQTNPNTNNGKPTCHARSKPSAKKVASDGVHITASKKGKQRRRLIAILKLGRK
ncbi:hypothetical protein BST61_g8596 [Cercospora zeina]